METLIVWTTKIKFPLHLQHVSDGWRLGTRGHSPRAPPPGGRGGGGPRDFGAGAHPPPPRRGTKINRPAGGSRIYDNSLRA